MQLTNTVKLKNGQEIDPAKLARMKKMMMGRAKTINGDANNIYFPPVSIFSVIQLLVYCLYKSFINARVVFKSSVL